jgi:enoyl-CoA hydratase/carnithine racemase
MPGVLYEKKGHIAYITLNRPQVLNAMNMEGWGELARSWQNVKDDNEVWTAIVTGADTGTEKKAFCVGMDLKEVGGVAGGGGGGGAGAVSFADIGAFFRGMDVWKPFIAAINGIATGGGLELAMLCDIRIAADNARLGMREVRQGLMPTGGGTQRLPRLVPLCKALEMLMTADFIDPQEAYRIGLVNKVVPQAELMNAAEEMATRICENGPLAVRAVKEAALRGLEMPLKEGVGMEAELSGKLMGTKDAMEGLMAFTMKRKAEFKAE